MSENATFVKALDEVGVTFIGPSEDAMAAMGDKIQSKIIAKESKVNIIPGFNGVVRDVDHALEICKCPFCAYSIFFQTPNAKRQSYVLQIPPLSKEKSRSNTHSRMVLNQTK